jgi:hypothetical protein
MILLPNSNDINYDIKEKNISFSMTFINIEKQVELGIYFKATEELQKTIEDLLNEDNA